MFTGLSYYKSFFEDCKAMRRAAKRDLAELAIVKCLRLSGWSVEYISKKDVPDLIIGKNGVTLLAEVKTAKGKLRPGQEKWHDEWRGSKPWILRDVEDVLDLNQWTSVASTEVASRFIAGIASANSKTTLHDLGLLLKRAPTTIVATPKRNGKRTLRRVVNE